MLPEEKQKVCRHVPPPSKKINLSSLESSKITKIRTLFIFFPSCRIDGNGNLQNKGVILKWIFCHRESRSSDNLKERCNVVP